MRVVDLKSEGVMDASYAWQNFAPACVSWSQPVRDQGEEAPYEYKEDVRVVLDGRTVLIGSIRKCALEQTGTDWHWAVEAYDILKPLEDSQYLSSTGRMSGRFSEGFNVSSGTTDSVKRRMLVASVLKGILNHAVTYGVLPGDAEIDVSVAAAATAWDTALGVDTYFSLLRKLLGLRPGMVMWVDYEGDAPTVRVADGLDLDDVMLDRAGDRLSAISLNPRQDLVPPAVGVILVRSGKSVGTQVYPFGADLRQEGCVTVQVDVPLGDEDEDEEQRGSINWDFTRPIVEVRGERLPTGDSDAKEWWAKKIPELNNAGRVHWGVIKKNAVLGVEGSDMDNYLSTAQTYEHVSGELSTACKTVKWSYVELKQFAWLTTPPPKSCAGLFPIRMMHGGILCYCNWFCWTGRTINVKHRKYRADKDGTDVTDDDSVDDDDDDKQTTSIPSYYGVLKDYYDATRAVPWEGQVTALRVIEPVTLVGRKMGITGVRSEYEDMNTIVQSVSLNIGSESTSVMLGVPDHLSLQDMMDRLQQLAKTQKDTNQDQTNNAVGQIECSFDSDNGEESPPAPSVGPEGKVIWSTSQKEEPWYALQVDLDYDESFGTVNGARMREVSFLMYGSVIGSIDGDTNGWKTLGQTSGEVWVNCVVNHLGQFVSASVSTGQGDIDIWPPLEAEEGKTYSYSFHVATISDNRVIQHMLGDIQLPIKMISIYPDGPTE